MTVISNPLLFPEARVSRRKRVFEGSSKTLYEGPDPASYVLYFKDDLDMGDRMVTIPGKGVLVHRISELLMSRLNDIGIETHFIQSMNMREQLVRVADPLPFYVTIHSMATGEFAARLGLDEGMSLPKPIPEFHMRSKELSNPLLATEHLISLGWSREDEIEDVLTMCQRVNDFMSGQFLALNLSLVNLTLKFGRYSFGEFMESQLFLIDELSPETFSVMDVYTRHNYGLETIQENPKEAAIVYQEIGRRLGVHKPTSLPSGE